MTAALNTKPGSSTARQRQTLVLAGKCRGFDLGEIRKTVGGSIRRLSAAECSSWIKHYSGRGLPNPPGQKPRAYRGTAGGIRIITQDQVEQLERLMLEYFDNNRPRAFAWLHANYNVGQVRDLATAGRANKIIHVLKAMHARRTPACLIFGRRFWTGSKSSTSG